MKEEVQLWNQWVKFPAIRIYTIYKGDFCAHLGNIICESRKL